MAVSCFYDTQHYRDINIALRSQFALLFNDELFPIYYALLTDHRNSKVLIFLYIMLNWLLFVTLMMRLMISVVATTFHYIRFISNNKDKKVTLQKFLENEKKKKISSKVKVSLNKEKSNHHDETQLLLALNKMALVNTTTLNENRILAGFKNLEDSRPGIRMNIGNNDSYNNQIFTSVKNLEQNPNSQNLQTMLTNNRNTNMKLEMTSKFYGDQSKFIDAHNYIPHEYLEKKLNRENEKKMNEYYSKLIFSEIILSDVDHSKFYNRAAEQFFQKLQKEVFYLIQNITNNDEKVRIIIKCPRLQKKINYMSEYFRKRIRLINNVSLSILN